MLDPPQERVRSLDAQCETLQRNSQAATLARQDAAASLDAARSELRAASQQAAAYREQLELRNNEVRCGRDPCLGWTPLQESSRRSILPSIRPAN